MRHGQYFYFSNSKLDSLELKPAGLGDLLFTFTAAQYWALYQKYGYFDTSSLDFENNYECTHEDLCMLNRHLPMEKEMINLYVGKSRLCKRSGVGMVTAGLGLFSLENIEKGTVIGEFNGELRIGKPETTGYSIMIFI